MTSKAEEIAKRVVRSWREEMSSQSLEAQLVAALREYGAEVRAKAAGVVQEKTLEWVKSPLLTVSKPTAAVYIDAIEREELP